MALGAARGRIMGGVVRRGLILSGIGLVVGALGALLVGRLLRGMLLDVPPLDPVVLAAVTAILLGVSLIALVVPAVRAMSVNPTETLRSR
jgi:ABC-type antimicrobial peptide transport system permease subunit